jgi:hypothetical protein
MMEKISAKNTKRPQFRDISCDKHIIASQRFYTLRLRKELWDIN